MNTDETRILLVEDEPTIRFVAAKQLKTLGFHSVATAENGLVGVEKALAEDYDLIFMDLRMPDLDGISATKRIRQAGKKSIIIGMTAFSQREECLSAGMNDFLQKPVLLEQLQKALHKWTSVDGAAESVQPTTSIQPEAAVAKKFEPDSTAMYELNTRIQALRKQTGLGEK